MKLLKTLASALCLAFLFTLLSSKAQTLNPGQVYTTGNIVQDTPYGGSTPWVGGVYQNQLTCWGQPGDTGYCGPSPIVRPGGNINFSYGSSYIYQQQHISTLLPSATGLQVNGYNFGFMAKNGNGWDDGRTDNLTALVRFWDNTNGRGATNLLYGDVYSLNYKFNWTSFDYSKTFTTPLAVPSIGQVQYGFIGRDNNGWAGPYGPEIYNVSFSLKYSVDPCATNVLSSPSCPGYLDALAKLIPAAPAATPPPEAAPAPPDPVAVAISPPGAPSPISAPPPVQESPQQTQPGPTQPGAPTSGPAPQQAASQPAANNQQPRAGEVADSGGGGKSSPVSLSSVLNMISSNQDKTSALEKSVVQSADAQAFSAGETAKQQAEKIAGDMQSQSMSASGGSTTTAQTAGTQSSFTQTQSSMVSLQGNQQSSNASNAARIQQSINSSVSSQSNTLNFTGTTTQQSSYQNTTRQETTVAMVTPQISYSLVAPTRSASQPQVEIPMLEGIKFGHKNAVDSAMESKPFVPQMNDNSQQNDSVKKNVDNNELAGNITIESIAKQPANYSQYFFMIPDVAFYAPKEIYRNQKNVDNVRALRQMSSDSLHQRMVDQQYK
jgi:hypothetical protein